MARFRHPCLAPKPDRLLDGGEIWQYTPHQDKLIDVLEIERIDSMGRGTDDKTKAPSVISFLVLKNPKQVYTGNIRVLPQPPTPPPDMMSIAANPDADATPPDMMSIAEAVEYTGKSEKTIRTWLGKMDGEKPMLPGVIHNGKLSSIPRTSLEPWRRRSTKKPPVKKPVKKKVKAKITG